MILKKDSNKFSKKDQFKALAKDKGKDTGVNDGLVGDRKHVNGIIKSSENIASALDSSDDEGIICRFNQKIDSDALENDVIELNKSIKDADKKTSDYRRKSGLIEYVTAKKEDFDNQHVAKAIKDQEFAMVISAINYARSDCYIGSVVPMLRMYSAVLVGSFEQLILLHASRSYLLNIIKISGDYIISRGKFPEKITNYLKEIRLVVDGVRSVLYDLKKSI
ncbi:hypothetical protein [Piscirickettsia litoralis]|uniref:Uncharacterized protein n=1 Tax=Piscirickettsia litoralis TaxID=1891921 RepID=A0ABX3A6A5_9GAMM|nr:hypothetical protein [Piscirickettsia litoralis]ODN41639.1 hypothetical protein BGC07_16225 [Piscirickettsia litoralis]